MKGPGETEALEWVDLPDPAPGPGEALVEIAAAGVNFMDIGARRGVIWTDLPDPKILGVEGAGRIVAVGDGVTEFRPGQRVAWV
jgi:NADPH2:quinone reductase